MKNKILVINSSYTRVNTRVNTRAYTRAYTRVN